ncbi:methyltransferase [Rhodovibrio salinarum]|uniref:methyltransferase n=1 Tax=Rhodovibrio salinarum TaxID=1087 RepID=UPI0004881154|nr:methyltransferase [Rhodovibrio salinarum]
MRDRLADWRNRLLASARFQRWAAGFPLTRLIARRQAHDLFDLTAGFVYAQVLYCCVHLGVFDLLWRAGPQTREELAQRVSLPLDGADRLVRAAIALKLLETRSDGRIGLGPKGAVVVGSPGIAAMVDHHAMLYADLADPVALLRGERGPTQLGGYWPYAKTDDPKTLPAEQVGAYSQLMAQSQPLVAAEALEAYPFHKHRRLLDVGGGDGAFLTAAAESMPALELMLFDLPAVAERARQQIAAAGLDDWVTTHGGDFFADPLPQGADVITLVRILHDHDDARVERLLTNVYSALPAGGTVVVAEPMASDDSAAPVGDAYFGFYLLAMGRGRARTAAEQRGFLRHAGFEAVREWRTRQPFLCRVISARKATRNVRLD